MPSTVDLVAEFTKKKPKTSKIKFALISTHHILTPNKKKIFNTLNTSISSMYQFFQNYNIIIGN